MGIVQQEPVLFGRSIRDNIVYGVPEGTEVTDIDVIKAAESANIHGFINNLPQVSFAYILHLLESSYLQSIDRREVDCM